MELTRRTWLGSASALAFGTRAAARSTIAPSVNVLGRGARDPAPLLAALAACASAEMQAYALPGLTMAVAGPDDLRATITLGFADIERGQPVRPEHLFQIGSISKSIVALCIFHLAEQGKLDLDARAAAILPDIPWPNSDITVAMLLNHSSGLADIAPAFPRSPDRRLWTNYPSGQRFSYSNTAFGLLGMMVTKISGLAFHKAARRFVFEALGMTDATGLITSRDRSRYPMGYVPLEDGAYFPGNALTLGSWVDNELAGGSVAATPADMARYIAYLMRVGQGRGAPIMSDSLARRYIAPTIDAPSFGPKGRYACGIATVNLDGRQCFQHTGGMVSFSSSITVDPLAGGVFASTNITFPGYKPRRISFHGCRLLRAFADGKPLPAPPALAPIPSVTDAAAFAGRYVAANGDVIIIAAQGDTLVATADSKPGRLLPVFNSFASDHSRLREHEIMFMDSSAEKNRLWWGGTLYGRNRAVETPSVPRAIAALTGRYVNDDPWWGRGFSLIARGDRLVLEGVGPLVPAGDGSWRADGEVMAAERFWFEAYNEGRPERLVFSGNDMRRFPEES